MDHVGGIATVFLRGVLTSGSMCRARDHVATAIDPGARGVVVRAEALVFALSGAALVGFQVRQELARIPGALVVSKGHRAFADAYVKAVRAAGIHRRVFTCSRFAESWVAGEISLLAEQAAWRRLRFSQ
jgi:hypothetical protein